MTSTVPFQILLAAIAWCAIVVPAVILRYINMPEKLLEFGSKREVDLTISNIMTNEITPAMVALIEKVVMVRDDKKAKGITIVYEEILEEVNFKPSLDLAQKALGKINEIHTTIDRLTDYSTPIWQIGMVHLMIVILVAVDYLFVRDPVGIHALWVLITAGALTLTLMLAMIVRYERRSRQLIRHLRNNQGH